MTDVKTDFAKNLYTEIESRHEGQCLVRNNVSQQVFLKKTLDVYSIPVYVYLKNHHDRNVAGIEDFWKEDDKLVVVEELVSGKTLEYMLDNSLLNDKQKADILDQICDGLIFLHSASPKIIHRDLKPSNIMVNDDNQVKIIDYDAAKVYNPQEKKDTVLMGTQGNAAPEQYGFMQSDERTDIYALGILMKQMFPNDHRLNAIAAKAASFSPDDRYSSVQELKDQLHRTFTWSTLFTNIPGLRSDNVFVKILAGVLYFICIAGLVSTRNMSDPKEVLTAVVLFIVIMNWVDLYGHWTYVFDQFPLIHAGKIWQRIAGYALATLGILFFWAMVLGMIQSLLK